MREFLGLILKSAESNKTGGDEVAALLSPLLADLSPFMTVKSSSNPKAPSWFTVRQMAQEASLKDLTTAMAVYLNRIDEHLSDG